MVKPTGLASGGYLSQDSLNRPPGRARSVLKGRRGALAWKPDVPWRLLFIVPLLASTSPAAWAHGGGLNAEGCHNDRKSGGYHCHRSSPKRSPWVPRTPPALAPQHDEPKAEPVPLLSSLSLAAIPRLTCEEVGTLSVKFVDLQSYKHRLAVLYRFKRGNLIVQEGSSLPNPRMIRLLSLSQDTTGQGIRSSFSVRTTRYCRLCMLTRTKVTYRV
jgi:hypothetical protein